MFHFISVSPHFMFHFILFSPQSISFISSATVNLIHFICHSQSHSHLTYLIALILHLHAILLSVSLFQPIPSLEINDLRVSLDKVLILDRYSLLEAELRWLHHSFPLYIKQEIQHGVRRNILVRSVADVYLIIHSTQTYLGKW